MVETLNIQVQATDVLHDARHGVPKCVTAISRTGKLYYVDIRPPADPMQGGVFEYDPRNGKLKNFPCLDANGKPEFTTAIGLNDDGSLIVARQSGIYYLNPNLPDGEDPWRFACKIPGVSDSVRPNNGVMIACSDQKTRLFLGTASLKPDANGVVDKSGKLFVLDNSRGRLSLQEVKGADGESYGFNTVNALSGQVLADGATHITFADSHKTDAVLQTAIFRPHSGRLEDVKTLIDFKAGGKEAANGRPDGTSPVLFKGRRCVAIAAIDTNEIRVHALDNNDLVAKITLPESVKKPTMATFAQKGSETVCYVSTLAPADANGALTAPDSPGGKIFKVSSPELSENFKAINYEGSYPSFKALKSAERHVSPASGGAVQGAGGTL